MHTAHWGAPTAPAPVSATVALPGSKSMTNRALVLAALATGAGTIRHPLRSRDTLLMAAGLRALGVRVEDVENAGDDRGAEGDGENSKNGENGENSENRAEDWRVLPPQPGRERGGGTVDVGNAGTVMRFLPPLAGLAHGDVVFDGDTRARERPVATLLAGLRALGADLDDGGRGALPFTVRGYGNVAGGPVSLDASESSQFVSGLLLAGPRFEKGVEFRHDGPPLPSEPHVAMTVRMLRAAGAEVDDTEPYVWRVSSGALRPATVEIEPDLTNAAPFLAAALVTGGEVLIPGWPEETAQPGDAQRDLLAAMGARVELAAGGLWLRGSGRVHGIDADLRGVSELAPTLAAVAALADSPTRLRGIAHMRSHETDRLAALAGELSGLGADARQTPDGLQIHPRPMRGGVFHSHDDHRLATAGAVLGLAVPGVEIDDIATTRKTLPGFERLWARMLDGAPEPPPGGPR